MTSFTEKYQRLDGSIRKNYIIPGCPDAEKDQLLIGEPVYISDRQFVGWGILVDKSESSDAVTVMVYNGIGPRYIFTSSYFHKKPLC